MVPQEAGEIKEWFGLTDGYFKVVVKERFSSPLKMWG
jgi:hypothetical protein